MKWSSQNSRRLFEPAFGVVVGCLVVVSVPGVTLAIDLHYVLVDSVRLPNTGSVTQFHVADLDSDGLDEVQVLFRDSYYAYSFARDSLISQDHQAYAGGTAGILTLNWDSDPEPEVLVKDLLGQLWLKDGATDTGFVVVDTIPEIGGGYLGAPGATMFMRDMNGDGFPDMIVSQLAEYFNYTGRIHETELYHTGDIGVYDLHNNKFLWKYSTPDWILPPSARSAEYSTCIDRDGEGRIGIVAWGQRWHYWWERNSMDTWVPQTTRAFDLTIYNQDGQQLLTRSSDAPCFVLVGDVSSEAPGDELVLVRFGASLDSASFSHSSGWAMYCVNLATDTLSLVWARECPDPVEHALFWYDSSETTFVYSDYWHPFQLIRSSDGSQIGQIVGLQAGLETYPCHALPTDAAVQFVQLRGQQLNLYQLQKPTDVRQGDPSTLPDRWSLAQNYPNPFNPSTLISFDVPAPSRVKLTVYNVFGQAVCELVDGPKPVGHHSVVWNGTDSNGRRVATGVYIYRLEANGQTLARKMLLLK